MTKINGRGGGNLQVIKGDTCRNAHTGLTVSTGRMARLILCLALFATCQGYRYFQDKIPNGDQVPHPCKDNFLWRGVGHKQPGGGGARNPFGEDFEKDKSWTTELCRKDSDGDGLTNGQELGDPDCIWTPGHFAERSDNISHPGICDPWGSERCTTQNSWVSCDAGIFKCDATLQPDVKNFTLRYPETHVPPTETNYYCMPFLMSDYLDMTKDYHMIASKPLINNTNVMHHIALFGCTDEVELATEARPCYMAQLGCNEILGIWTLGLPGTCEYEEAGYLIGKSGSKKMVMQFHWTNPELRTDYVDSSGLTLYYTEKKRRYNAGMFLSGQLYLNIPPGTQRMQFEGSCNGLCTNNMIKNNIFFTSGLSHMHYLGFLEKVETFRNGKKKFDLIADLDYSYDSPQVHTYDKPIEFRQGDTLKTTCVYKSVSKTRTTLYGEGSYDEMCFSLLSFYPKENITRMDCHQWKDLDLCKYDMNDAVIDECDTHMYYNKSSSEMRHIMNEVMDNCNQWGPCRPECPAVVNRLKKHPCLHGDIGEFLLEGSASNRDVEMIKFAHAFASCDKEMESYSNPDFQYPVTAGASGVSVSVISVLMFLLCLV